MDVFLIKTPSDFKRSLGSHGHIVQEWFSAIPQMEPQIRHTIEAIFNDLPLIDVQEPVMVSSYLDAITQPLNDLQALRLQMLAILSTATNKSGGREIPNWRMTRYIIAPDPCFFATVAPAEATVVHLLDPSCSESIAVAKNSEMLDIQVFPDLQLLDAQFEHNIPWCPQCRARSFLG
jgi:hypothetical protein